MVAMDTSHFCQLPTAQSQALDTELGGNVSEQVSPVNVLQRMTMTMTGRSVPCSHKGHLMDCGGCKAESQW